MRACRGNARNRIFVPRVSHKLITKAIGISNRKPLVKAKFLRALEAGTSIQFTRLDFKVQGRVVAHSIKRWSTSKAGDKGIKSLEIDLDTFVNLEKMLIVFVLV
jgi:hypothetical protein